MCPECGTPFYDGCFCTPRSVKRATRTKDQADDADAVQYMHSTFGERMRMFYSEPEPSDALNESNEVFDIRSQFRSSPPPPPSPIVPPPPARKPSILYVHPDGTVLKNPPPAGPTIAELIEQANHRANRNPTQSPPQLPDAGPASVPPQSSQSVVPPPPTRKPDVSTWVASKPQPPPVHASEAPARPTLLFHLPPPRSPQRPPSATGELRQPTLHYSNSPHHRRHLAAATCRHSLRFGLCLLHLCLTGIRPLPQQSSLARCFPCSFHSLCHSPLIG